MRRKAGPPWFLPGWVHKHLNRKRKFARLRARDGDNCWRCNKPMRFEGTPNCGRAATFEHLTPLRDGGTWALDNLVLCHVGCNKHLGTHSREQKERMRINQPSVESPKT